ncbi:MAG: phosphoribosylamine--glycine ligase [Anaerovoracaceae bacterium]|jgi:phosphoribosylamine--glycine ligase
MNILVVGGGGREHAIIKKLKENKAVKQIYALPGNGGIAYDAVCVNIKATDLDGITEFAGTHDIDFAVIGPDDPLAAGAVDRLLAIGIPAFGPTANAAIIEGSKVFSKELMKRYKIPTANYEVFDSAEKALSYINSKNDFPVVIKADGLALGKGVIIAKNQKEAENAIQSIMKDRIFGDSGNRVVVEEFLTGPEVSVLAFTDSKTLIPMVSSMDHKRALDGDQGLNTGGMGTVAPNPYYTEEVADQCMKEIFLPTIEAMNKEGRPFKGCLYFGLMLTENGPKVIEYNCRFGDPEAQVVLPLLTTDLLTIMQAVTEERLSEVPVEFDKGSACCVVAASGGYPKSYQTGLPISGLTEGGLEGASVFHAGTRLTDQGLLTSGGRVLGVTAVDDCLEKAIENAYQKLKQIEFKGMHFRTDIGQRALKARGL